MKLPSAGKGTETGNMPGVGLYDNNSALVTTTNPPQAQSMMTRILPFIEANNVYDLFHNLNLETTRTPRSHQATITPHKLQLTRSSAHQLAEFAEARENDSGGYGFTDYAPIILVDDTITQGQNRWLIGVFNGRSGRRIGSVTDGTSNTIGIAETTGRDEAYGIAGPMISQLAGGGTCLTEQINAENAQVPAIQAPWRWADPTNAFIASTNINSAGSSRDPVARIGVWLTVVQTAKPLASTLVVQTRPTSMAVLTSFRTALTPSCTQQHVAVLVAKSKSFLSKFEFDYRV